MLCRITALVLVVTLLPAPAFTQVKRWVDENGVVHYEATGPDQPKKSDPTEPKLSARRPLDRNHGGLTLGDNETVFVEAKKGDYIGNIGSNGRYYRYNGCSRWSEIF